MSTPTRRLTTWATQSPRIYERKLLGPLAVGDPILDSERNYVGRVTTINGQRLRWGKRRVLREGTVEVDELHLPAWLDTGRSGLVTIAIDPEANLPEGVRFEPRLVDKEDSGWIVKTLLPEHKREIVYRELSLFLEQHEEEVTAAIRPLAEDLVQRAVEVFQDNLSTALESRQDEIKALLDRHRDMVKDDVLPVIKDQLGASAKKKAEPILKEIGRELWNELPMWSVSWRYLFDRIPYTSQDRLDEWWVTFVDEKAVPILSSHEADLIRALEELIEEGAADPKVREALSRATLRLSRDPDFKRIMRGVLEDALVRPIDLRTTLQQLWKNEEHQERLSHLRELLSPALKRIGRLLTVDEQGRIDPGLARVLRRVVFNKDARWIEALPPEVEQP